MKTVRRILCLLLVLCMACALAPFEALAVGEKITYTMQKVVKTGESVAVWNDDIAASGVTSNKITVQITEGSNYDIVFPENASAAGALSHYTAGIDVWETDAYIKAEAAAGDGMLVWIKVNAGKVLLTVESTMNEDAGVNPLSLYAMSSSPLSYSSVSTWQALDYFLPQHCSLSNITMILGMTDDAEIERTASVQNGRYESYRCEESRLVVSSYENDRKISTHTVPCSSALLFDNKVYNCAAMLYPAGSAFKDLGAMKVLAGSAIVGIPRIVERDTTKYIAWDDVQHDDPGWSAEKYDPLTEVFCQGSSNDTWTFESEEQYNAPAVGVVNEPIVYDSTWSSAEEELYKHKAYSDEEAGQSENHDGLWSFEDSMYECLAKKYQVPFRPDDINYCNVISYFDDLGYKYTVNPVEYQQPVWQPNANDNCRISVVNGRANVSEAKKGDTVELTAVVPAGMEFKNWGVKTGYASFEFDNCPETFASIEDIFEDIVFIAVCEPHEFDIIDGTGVNGIATAGKSCAAANETVCVTVAPDPGCRLTSLEIVGASGQVVGSTGIGENKYEFVMPEENVTVSAVCEKIPYSIGVSAVGGTLTSNVGTATVGDTVTLTPAPFDGQHFLGALSVRCGDESVETIKNGDGTYRFTMPAGDVTADAMFVQYYFVSFENWNGEVLQWSDLTTGQTPAYTGETPVCEENEMYYFTFAGWDREIVPVSGDTPFITYTATFTAIPQSYTVSFLDGDGTVLQSGELTYGTTPEYLGATPVKTTDENYVYTFSNWDKEIAPVTGETIYQPVFSTVPVLHEGRNDLALVRNETVNLPFTPEKSGYYRIRTAGEEAGEMFAFTDGNGTYVDVISGGYDPDRDWHFELFAELEAGVTYDLVLTAYSRDADLRLYVYNVDAYSVTVDESTVHGTVDPGVDEGLAYTGQTFYPWAQPDDGYGLLSLIVTDAEGKRVKNDNGRYIMPDSDVTITAVFAPAYTVNCDVDGVYWSNNEAIQDYWTDDGFCEQRAAGGAGVEFKFMWDEGYILEEFNVKTASGESVTFGASHLYANTLDVWFTMPDEEITITARVAEAHDLTFVSGQEDGKAVMMTAKDGVEITLPACPFTAPDGTVFAGWSVVIGDGEAVFKTAGEKITMTENVTATAIYAPRSPYDLNGDAVVNIGDVTAHLNYLTSGGTNDALFDLNNDEAVNITDVTALLDHLSAMSGE